MRIGRTLSKASTSGTSTCPDASVVAQTSDEALIKLISDDDRCAFETLYRRHHARIFRFLVRLIGDHSVAEELVNEVFLEVWRHAHRFETKSQTATWMLAIARYKALSALRRRSCAQFSDEARADVADPADDPETTLDRRSRSAILRWCLTQLPAAQREVIDLVYYHDKSVEEVAGFVGVPAGTVKTRMFYARNRMASLLNEAGLDGVLA
jgi:RNA polymerase sigma-70 factor (ECF subfamily)